MNRMRATLLVLLLSLAISTVHAENIDERLYRSIHDGWRSQTMDAIMEGASELARSRNVLGFCLMLSAFGGPRERGAAKLSFTAVVGGEMVTTSLKYAVGRKRPSGTSPRSNSSFPSGHATEAFALAYVFGEKYHKLRIPLYLVATTVALSRVYVGRHYPTDVAAGAFIGCAAGWTVVHFEEKILAIHF